MILAVEGLSCVGKTSLINTIALENSSVNVIPEWCINVNHIDYGNDVFRLNDLLKSRLIKISKKNDIYLDRYFISSVVCQLYARKFDEADSVEFFKKYARSFYLPDVWIYITEEPELSFERVIKCREKNINDPWLNFNSSNMLNNYYVTILNTLPNVIFLPSLSCPKRQLEVLRSELFESYNNYVREGKAAETPV